MAKTPKGGTVKGPNKFCGACKRWKPLVAFYQLEARGYRVTGCFACAQRRIALWAQTPLSKMDPDKITEMTE